MSPRKRNVLLGIAAFAIVTVASGAVGGCTSSALPPKPTASQLDHLLRTHFKASVGVEKAKFPAYSERLVEALRKTGLFDRVDHLENLPEATLVARVERHIYGNAVIPVLTGITLGIVPTVTTETHGHAFSLSPRSGAGRKVAVDFTYSGATILGWYAGLANLSPDRTSGDPYTNDRFYQALAVKIGEQSGEITSLMK